MYILWINFSPRAVKIIFGYIWIFKYEFNKNLQTFLETAKMEIHLIPVQTLKLDRQQSLFFCRNHQQSESSKLATFHIYPEFLARHFWVIITYEELTPTQTPYTL